MDDMSRIKEDKRLPDLDHVMMTINLQSRRFAHKYKGLLQVN